MRPKVLCLKLCWLNPSFDLQPTQVAQIAACKIFNLGVLNFILIFSFTIAHVFFFLGFVCAGEGGGRRRGGCGASIGLGQHKITIATLYCLFYQIKLTNFLNSHEGSVKDSVVGEERIAQYLLAVLNTRGTPLHWKHLNNRRLEGIRYDSKEKHEYNLKDLRPKRRKPPNDSDMLYVEVIYDGSHLLNLCRMAKVF